MSDAVQSNSLASSKPWDIHEHLKQEHLLFLVRMFQKVWLNALRSYRPELGDGPWGFGAKIYERWMRAILLGAEQASWLSVITDGLQFVAAIGDVPFRFLRGKPDAARHRVVPRPEESQLKLAFPGWDNPPTKWSYRFVIDAAVLPQAVDAEPLQKKDLGPPTIYLVQFDAETGDVGQSWLLSSETLRTKKPAPMTTAPEYVLRAPVDVEPATITRKQQKKKASGSNDVR